MATWKKTPLVNTVKATSGSTYKTGSSSVGYYGCDADDKYVSANACALVFDTSDFPSDSILKYKDCKLGLHVNGTNGHKWYIHYDGEKISDPAPEYSALIRSVEASASSVVDKSYNWLTSNWKSQGSMSGMCDGEDEVLDATKFHHQSMVILLKKSDDGYGYYCSRVSQSGTYLELTYNDIKPSASFTYEEGNSYKAQPYKVSWKYKDSKERGQAAWKLVWTSSTGKTGTVTGTTENEYTFPAYTFPVGDVVFEFSVKSGGDGVWSSGVKTSKTITFVNSVPSVSAKDPVNGEQVYRATAQTFGWDYSDPASVPQSAYRIDWSCAGATGTTGTVSNANKYHTFPGYTFPNGEVTYYITVWNKDGLSSKSGPYTLNAINSTPKAEVESPRPDDEFNHYAPLTIKWKYSDEAGVAQKAFEITYTNGGITKKVSGLTASSYTFPVASLAEGEVTYCITVWNKDGESYTTETQIAMCVMSIPTVTASYPVAVSVQKSREFTFSWMFEETFSTGQKSWKLEATQNGSKKTFKGTTETTYTVPAYYFEKGQVTYKITVTNNDGKTASTGDITFYVDTSKPTIGLVYPNAVLVKGTEEQIFTWNYSETVDVGQKQYWIELTHDGITSEYTEETDKHYHVFAPNTLPNGNSTFSIKAINADGEWVKIGPFILTVVSESAAPTIVSVTNDAKPTIAWETYSQDGFELVIEDNYQKVIYASGFVIGSDTREYQVDELIPNGRYLMRLRVQNEYGYYTPYAVKSVEISVECRSSIESVIFYNTTDYGLAIEADYSGGTAYVIRRNPITGEEKNMGEYRGKYVDYTIPANTNMQYCIRLYDGGITNSSWGIGYVQIPGALIRNTSNPEDYVVLELTDTEDFNIYHSDVREKSKIKLLGRPYAVTEASEWMTVTRNLRAYATKEDFEKLMKYARSGNATRYQAENEYFLADIEVADEGKYMSGRMVSLTVSRVDDGGE